jgi:hypothetical protein
MAAQEEGASRGRLTPNDIFLRFLLARCLPPPRAVRRVPRSEASTSGQWGWTWSLDHGTPRMSAQGAVGRRPAVSAARRYPRAGGGAGPGLRITGRSACLFRVPPSGRTSPLVRLNRKAHARDDRANFAHLPCELLAPVTAHSLPTSVPLVGPAAARALQLARVHIGGAPAARKTSHHERTLAVGAPPCSLPRPGTPRRTAPFGEGLAQPARRSPRTRCLWFVRCLFFRSPEALSACGLLEPVTCTEAVSRLIHRA